VFGGRCYAAVTSGSSSVGTNSSPCQRSSNQATNTQVAVHVGRYRLGPPDDEFLCGRLTALNMRIDLPSVLSWIMAND
jgi:hypothetical protein